MNTTTTAPADLSSLKASRKADRQRIAAEFIRIAERFGATVTQRDEPPHPGYSGAQINLSFKLEGVGAQVSISDLHERHGSPGGLVSWYNEQEPGEWQARRTAGLDGVKHFAPGFNTAVGEMNGSRHHHKATSCGSWDLLAARLQAGLRKAASRTAFIEDTTP